MTTASATRDGGTVERLIARRVSAATTLDGPNERFMELVQNPIWNFLCDHYFRLEIDGWQRIPDEPSLLIGVHSGGCADDGRVDTGPLLAPALRARPPPPRHRSRRPHGRAGAR